jgi:hypothetical protein
LADGSRSCLNTYSCMLQWFGKPRSAEVIANQGQIPLLGVGLLVGHRLIIDYDEMVLSIE